MLDFYLNRKGAKTPAFQPVDVIRQSPSLDRTYLGSLAMDELDELIRLNIVSNQPSLFNYSGSHTHEVQIF